MFESYREFMIDTYGSGALNDLILKAKSPWKWDKVELEKKMVDINQRILEQEKRVVAYGL